MKVTAGKFKGRPLIENKFNHIRPTADVVKQALFNKICFDLPGAKVLDLCAGTGALGIEAISRGAGEVVFVDKDSRSCNLIKQNLANLKTEAKVFRLGALEACQLLKNAEFDFIFFDPPYKSDLYEPVIEAIEKYNLLTGEGIIAVEHAKEDSYNWSEAFKVLDEKIYGIKKITYLSKVTL